VVLHPSVSITARRGAAIGYFARRIASWAAASTVAGFRRRRHKRAAPEVTHTRERNNEWI
jgi:hypothetical protein